MMIMLRIVIVLMMSIGIKLNATGLPNPSDRPAAQDKTIDISADALYWHTSETVDWAFTHVSNNNFQQSIYRTISFGWDPGFRVGLGYNMHHDQWDTQIAYTWFQTHAKADASGAVTSGFLAARLSLLEPFQNGKMRCNIHFNMFDWDLGRSFLVSNFLSLRPYLGGKGGWINQKIHLKWTTPNFLVPGFLYFASEEVKNNFRGGGPKGGINTKWILGRVNDHAFSIIGNFAVAYLWGHWTLRDAFIDVLLTKTAVKMKDRNFGALMLQALMGFGWDVNFDKNRSHFSLKLGYEIQDWLNQFQVYTNIAGTDNADLVLQGLTADLRFDF